MDGSCRSPPDDETQLEELLNAEAYAELCAAEQD